MKKVVVIGCGASGIISSIFASKNNEVIVLEKNQKPLKKLLLTGNGKCNYFNNNQSIYNYNSTDLKSVENLITKDNIKNILDFFDSIGIIPKIKNGYYYPFSNLSSSIYQALVKEAEISGVKINLEYLVETVEKKGEKFIINNDIICDYIVLATGSKAYPKTGSDGFGYEVLKKLGHKIIKPLPALTQIIGNELYFKDWAGIRVDAKVSLYENDKLIKEDMGEVQLTSSGLSGICVFNLSGRLKRGLDNNNKEDIVVNFLPFVDDIDSFMLNRNNLLKNRTIIELLEGVINYKLLRVILRQSKINENKFFNDLTQAEKNFLYKNLISFKVNIVDTNDFEGAQVCSGGVSLEEINLYNMESKIVSGLFIVGELLDIDGICGGYNLTVAWLSGMLAGKYIGEIC